MLTPLCDLPRVLHTDGNPGPCLHDLARADSLMPAVLAEIERIRADERQQVLAAEAEVDRLNETRGRDAEREIRIIQTLTDALGLDPDDADSCVPGCDYGAQGVEHDLAHLIEHRDQVRTVLLDIADNGLRADLNPTVSSAMDGGGTYRELTAYLRRLDASLRERARAALDGIEATP